MVRSGAEGRVLEKRSSKLYKLITELTTHSSIMAPISILLLPLAFALAFADVAYYVPKSFYTIDRFGHESDPVMLLGGLRSRRSANPLPESQSFSFNGIPEGFDPIAFGLSAANSNGGPVQVPNFIKHAQDGVQRFSGSSDSGLGGIAVSSQGEGGSFVSTSSYTDENGKTHYKASKGSF